MTSLLFATIKKRCRMMAITTALIFIFLFHKFGASWLLLAYAILTCGFILLVVIDSEHYLLPDVITLPLLWLGLLGNTFNLFTSAEQSIWGAILGYLSLYLVSGMFRQLRGVEGLGLGDCKLFAVFGAWWGMHALLPILLTASLTGSVVGVGRVLMSKQSLTTPIPFGPYLILGAAVFLVFFC